MLLYIVVAEVPTCTKLLQPGFGQLSTRYWLIVPPVSVEAIHERSISTGPAAVAVKLVGAVGEFAGVVPLAVFE
jgi:hypothetical protein